MGAAARRLITTGRRLLAWVRTAGLRACRRIGPRGAVLLAIGWQQITYGYQIITDPRYGVVRGVGVLRNLAPMSYWGGLWVVAGLIAVAMSMERRAIRDAVGYGATFVPYFLWSVANLYASISGDYPQAYPSAAAWGTYAVITIMINRWLGAPRREGTRGNGPR
jgi:hypothetical protein